MRYNESIYSVLILFETNSLHSNINQITLHFINKYPLVLIDVWKL